MPNRRELGYVSAGSVSTIPATTGYGVATGGSSSSITVGGVNYTLLTFTTDGTLTVTKAGLFDVLLVAGGGAAGSGRAAAAGAGGGAGGVFGLTTVTTLYIDANQSIDVGAGGTGVAADDSRGISGLGSSIGSLVSVAGGGGGDGSSTGANNQSPGGSTGGRAWTKIDFNHPVIATSIQGNVGGLANNTSFTQSGGGGGAGGVGGTSPNSTTGGTGGAGVDISTFIGGAAYFASAGGGGGGTTGGAATTGGVAGKSSGAGNNGVNYGAGGGGSLGAGATNPGGNGAAGVVVVRFKV